MSGGDPRSADDAAAASGPLAAYIATSASNPDVAMRALRLTMLDAAATNESLLSSK
jgi:hypothetical protein